MVFEFEFDFNDLGLVKADIEADYSTKRTPSGFSVDVTVTGVELHSDDILVKKKTLLKICNDQTGAVYSAIKEEIINRIASEVA